MGSPGYTGPKITFGNEFTHKSYSNTRIHLVSSGMFVPPLRDRALNLVSEPFILLPGYSRLVQAGHPEFTTTTG